jgi:hypothetical protein
MNKMVASLEAMIRTKVTEVVRSVLQSDAQVTAGIVAQLDSLIRDRLTGLVRGVTHEDPALAARFRPYRAEDASFALDWCAARSPDAPDASVIG